MSLFLTILGSGLTILGGTLIYSWQKSFDRIEDLHRELREAYKNYFVSLARQTSVYGMEPKNFEDTSRTHSVCVETLSLIAPKDVVDAVILVESARVDFQLSYDSESRKFDRELLDVVGRLRLEALSKMRSDLFRKTDTLSKLKSAVADWRKK